MKLRNYNKLVKVYGGKGGERNVVKRMQWEEVMKDHNNIAGNSRTCGKHTEDCIHFMCQITSKNVLRNLKHSKKVHYKAHRT